MVLYTQRLEFEAATSRSSRPREIHAAHRRAYVYIDVQSKGSAAARVLAARRPLMKVAYYGRAAQQYGRACNDDEHHDNEPHPDEFDRGRRTMRTRSPSASRALATRSSIHRRGG